MGEHEATTFSLSQRLTTEEREEFNRLITKICGDAWIKRRYLERRLEHTLTLRITLSRCDVE
jgi:hypothetical protein